MQFLKKVISVVFLIINFGLFYKAELNSSQLSKEQIIQVTQLFYTDDFQEALREQNIDKIEKILERRLYHEAKVYSFASFFGIESLSDWVLFIGAFLGTWYFLEKRDARGKSMNMDQEKGAALPV